MEAVNCWPPREILWCGEGDLFSRTTPKIRKLYTTQSSQNTRSARSAPPSHTTSHTGLPEPPLRLAESPVRRHRNPPGGREGRVTGSTSPVAQRHASTHATRSPLMGSDSGDLIFGTLKGLVTARSQHGQETTHVLRPAWSSSPQLRHRSRRSRRCLSLCAARLHAGPFRLALPSVEFSSTSRRKSQRRES